jgi:hypothetical protein
MVYLQKGSRRNLKDSRGRFHCLVVSENNFRPKPSACYMNPQQLNISWLQCTTCKEFPPYYKSKLAMDDKYNHNRKIKRGKGHLKGKLIVLGLQT